MSVTDSTSQLPASIHTPSWLGQALPSFPFPGFIVSDTGLTLCGSTKEIILQSTPRWKSVTFLKFFEKAGFQFSCGSPLLGNTVPHYALVDHPDIHDNTAVLSQSRYALLRGDQVIPDQDGECHTGVC